VEPITEFVPDSEQVRAETAALLARVRAAQPQARIDGVVVQQMVCRPGAIELLVGLSEDPVFGPVVVFGQGGTTVEIVQDSAISLPPLNLLLARGQMAQTRVWHLLQAYRSKPAAAIDAIAEVLIRFGQLAAEHAEIRELDINPLLADVDGVVALDARIRVAAGTVTGSARLAIAPYPKHLETQDFPGGAAPYDLAGSRAVEGPSTLEAPAAPIELPAAEPAAAARRIPWRCKAPGIPSQYGPHARQKLAKAERLGNAVIGTELEPRDLSAPDSQC
jgi:ATP-grasp domain